MREFQDWRLGKGEETSQILWIRGPPGFGKSTLAGYFVEMIRQLYPDSIVAYFFCLSGAEGLVKVHNIIRSLAYQISRADGNARDFLLRLREEGELVGNHGVEFLFEKLLLGSMNQTQKEVFVIIDGLDEADTVAIGNRSGKTEMEIFLKSLGMTSARLLFISRPDFNVSEILSPHHTTVVQVGMTHNAQDIETYVDHTVSQSQRLRTLFKEANIEPVEYFVRHSNGIFLWVAVVLQELQRFKSVSEFETQIHAFTTRSSGSMDAVYSGIISKLEPTNRRWVAEILRWVVAAEGQLLILDLQEVVEHAMGEKLVDFNDFIDVDCGSLLQRTPGKAIQLVHATFRSFLLDSTKCPFDFYVDENEIHVHLASVCLDYLAKLKTNGYIKRRWVTHLNKATRQQTSLALLKPLHQLFTSQGLGRWIETYRVWIFHRQRSLNGLTMVRIHCNESELDLLYDALKSLSKWTTSIESLQNDEFARWAACLAADRCELLEFLGKVAAKVWLFGEFEDSSNITQLFLFALKFYRTRKGRIFSAELQNLFESEFMIMTDEPHGNLQATSIAIAFFTLERWNDCLRWFNIAEQTTKTRMYMVLAHLNNSDYDKGICVSKKALEQNSAELWAWQCLGILYVKMKDHKAAIEAFEKAMEIYDPAKEEPHIPYTRSVGFDDFEADYVRGLPKIIACLLELYRKEGEHDKAIQMCTMAVEQFPTMLWPLRALAGAFRANRAHDAAIRILRDAVEKFPTTFLLWKQLLNEYEIVGDHVRQVEVMKEAVQKNPTVGTMWTLLGELYQERGEYDAAIKVVEQAYEVDRQSAWRLRSIVEMLLVKGEYARVISLCQSAIANAPANCQAIELLGKTYRLQSRYPEATKVYQEALNKDSNDFDGSFRTEVFLWLGETLMEKGDVDGAIDAFLKCIDDDTTYQAAYRGLCILYKATAPAKITSLLENRIQENPYDAWVWMKLGDLYHAVGALDASNNAYDKVIEITKVRIGMEDVRWRWTDWIFLSRALKARGMLEEATHAVERAIQIHETEIEIDPRNDMVGQISGLIHPETICGRCRLRIRGYHFVCLDDCAWSMLCGNCVRHPSHDSNHETISLPSKKWVSNRFPNEPDSN